jgi:ATP-dependent RNA helicase RhlE
MSFESLGLSDALLRAVADVGYTTPTPIQLQAIPAVMSGGDLMAGAQTGTGKTAGFVLPLLQRLAATPRAAGKRPIRVLILTPTRELAAQVEESVRVYGKYLEITSTVVFGGVSINPQIDMLRRGVDILVATPGRLLDHCGQRTVDLSKVETLVLDEADRMLDMGFIPDIKRIIALLPRKRQNLLFSATFSDEIRDLANGMLQSPTQIQATPRNTTVEAVSQTVHPVEARRKAELLVHLVKDQQWFQVLVFTRTKHGANKLALQLEKNGITALAIHGNKSQNARTRALAEFKAAKLQVLVATDIAARGLDIEQLPHVVNFDLPNVPEDYVHRIGRTGRAGATGEAISLVSPEERPLLRDIERVIKRSIPRSIVPGFEAGSTAAPIETAEVPAGRSGPPRGRERSGNGPSRGGDRTRSAAPRPAAGSGRPRGAGPARPARPAHAAHNAYPAEGREVNGNVEAPKVARPADINGNVERPPASAPARRARTDAAGPRNGASPRHGQGASAEAPRGAARTGSRSGAPRHGAPVDPTVRSNLPPGWSLNSSGRRGGR